MLVDRPTLIQTVRYGMASIAASPFPTGSPDFDTTIQALPYDPRRASALLDEAGWIDHNGNETETHDKMKREQQAVHGSDSGWMDVPCARAISEVRAPAAGSFVT